MTVPPPGACDARSSGACWWSAASWSSGTKQCWRSGPASLRRRLHGVRLASPDQPAPVGPLRVQRRVSSRGVTQVAGQTLRVGFAHRHTLVDIDVHETEFHVYDQAGELLTVAPRTSGKEVTRTKGYGVRDRGRWGPQPSDDNQHAAPRMPAGGAPVSSPRSHNP